MTAPRPCPRRRAPSPAIPRTSGPKPARDRPPAQRRPPSRSRPPAPAPAAPRGTGAAALARRRARPAPRATASCTPAAAGVPAGMPIRTSAASSPPAPTAGTSPGTRCNASSGLRAPWRRRTRPAVLARACAHVTPTRVGHDPAATPRRFHSPSGSAARRRVGHQQAAAKGPGAADAVEHRNTSAGVSRGPKITR